MEQDIQLETRNDGGAGDVKAGEPAAVHETTKPSELESGPSTLRPHPRDGWTPWKWKAFILISVLMVLTGGYDVSNVANIQTPLYRAFGRIELLVWITLSYALGTTAFIPLFRNLADFADLRALWLGSGALFIVGNVLDGTARSMAMVIAGRVVTGVGVAGALQCLLIYQAMFSTPTELPRLQGLFGLCYAVGLISGPIVGGAFAENRHATWRWAFFIVLPFLAVTFSLVCLAVPPVRIRRDVSLRQGLSQMGFPGLALHAATFALLSIAVVFSGALWSWSAPSTIAVWALLGAVFLAYVLQQTLVARRSGDSSRRLVLPISLLRERRVLLVCLNTVMCSISFAVFLYYTPLLLTFGLGLEPLTAAVRLLPFIFSYIAATVAVGFLLPVVQRYKVFYVLSPALVLAASAAMATLDHHRHHGVIALPRILGIQTLAGLGTGLTFQMSLAVISFGRPPSQRLDSAMLQTMTQQGGILLALGVSGCVFQNVGFSGMEAALAGRGFSEAQIREALAGLSSLVWEGGNAEVVHLAAASVTETMTKLYYLPLAASVVGLVGGLAMEWERLDIKGAREAAARG